MWFVKPWLVKPRLPRDLYSSPTQFCGLTATESQATEGASLSLAPKPWCNCRHLRWVFAGTVAESVAHYKIAWTPLSKCSSEEFGETKDAQKALLFHKVLLSGLVFSTLIWCESASLKIKFLYKATFSSVPKFFPTHCTKVWLKATAYPQCKFHFFFRLKKLEISPDSFIACVSDRLGMENKEETADWFWTAFLGKPCKCNYGRARTLTVKNKRTWKTFMLKYWLPNHSSGCGGLSCSFRWHRLLFLRLPSMSSQRGAAGWAPVSMPAGQGATGLA